MAVLYQNDQGWLLCHKMFINRIYENCASYSGKLVTIKVKDEFFDINTPLLMDSEAYKYSLVCKKCSVELHSQKKYKKKKKKLLIDDEAYHGKVVSFIKSSVKVLLEEAAAIGYLKDCTVSPEEWLTNNYPARSAAKEVLETKVYACAHQPHFSYENKNDFPIIEKFYQKDFVVPARSTFIHCDMKNIDVLIGDQYDAIVIDPPWQNKSVRRKDGYRMIKFTDLLELPIPALMKSTSLVFLWVTNNESQIRFVKEILFPTWRLQHCADWHWVKMTTRGTFIYPIDSPHKKPYENIIIGCRDSAEVKILEQKNKVILSVPSSIHSHKPPLSDILKQYLPTNAKCLELYARYLIPGWTSCGNEVLKLQSITLFKQTDNCEEETDECSM